MNRIFVTLPLAVSCLAVCFTLESMDKSMGVPFENTVGSGVFTESKNTFVNPSRKNARNREELKEDKRVDHFCKPEFEGKNVIVSKDSVAWLILNQSPFSRDGYHLMWIPIRHCDDVSELTAEETQNLLATFFQLERAFSTQNHQIHYFINKGADAGASVPHVHWHILIRPHGPKPLYEETAMMPAADPDLKQLKTQILEILAAPSVLLSAQQIGTTLCRPCWYANGTQEQDQHRLIMHRDGDFIVAVPPFPDYSGQVVIVPVRHCECVAHMDEQLALKFLGLIKKLSGIVGKTTDEGIRQCTGLGTEVVSYGEKEKKAAAYNHIFCLLTPSTPSIKRLAYFPFDPKEYAAAIAEALNK